MFSENFDAIIIYGKFVYKIFYDVLFQMDIVNKKNVGIFFGP